MNGSDAGGPVAVGEIDALSRLFQTAREDRPARSIPAAQSIPKAPRRQLGLRPYGCRSGRHPGTTGFPDGIARGQGRRRACLCRRERNGWRRGVMTGTSLVPVIVIVIG